MTPDQVALVERTYARVFAVRHPLSTAFFDRLFQRAPSQERLHPADPVARSKAFATVLGFLLQVLERPDRVAQPIATVSRAYTTLGLTRADLDVLREVFIGTLADMVPGGLTTEELYAWRAAHETLSEEMLRAGQASGSGGASPFVASAQSSVSSAGTA